MRVAHLITRLILGGAQENTILTCQGLRKRYHDDVLLVSGPGLGPEGSLEDDARRRGVSLSLVPALRRAIHPWFDVKAYRGLRRVLIDFAPDVVHTHSGKAGLLGRMAAWSLGVPAVVHTVHGAPFHPYQNVVAREFFRRCERFAAARCHALVSVADAMTDQLVRAGVAPREKFVTIYSGLEVEPLLLAERWRCEMRRELGYRETDVVIGKIARLFYLKGHVDVIRAAEQVVRQRPEARFLMVGDGMLREQLADDVKRRGLADHFRFVGRVPPDSIPQWISAMDIVVHASYREGLARVLPQALIAGRPVVSYDIDGAREVVLDGVTGRLITAGDVEALAGAVLELVADAALRERLAAEGRRRWCDVFRHERMTDALRQVYLRLLENRPPSPAEDFSPGEAPITLNGS